MLHFQFLQESHKSCSTSLAWLPATLTTKKGQAFSNLLYQARQTTAADPFGSEQFAWTVKALQSWFVAAALHGRHGITLSHAGTKGSASQVANMKACCDTCQAVATYLVSVLS